MKLSEDEFLAIAFTFEKRNGNKKEEWETQLINDNSHITNLETEELEKLIISGIENNIFQTDAEITTAYWALSKTYNKNLISFFQKSLQKELDQKKSGQVYQILIALENINEKVFTRTGTAAWEDELNFNDAEQYLSNI